MEGLFDTGRNVSQKDELMGKHPNRQQNLRRAKLARFSASPICCASKSKTLWGKKNGNFHVRSVSCKTTRSVFLPRSNRTSWFLSLAQVAG